MYSSLAGMIVGLNGFYCGGDVVKGEIRGVPGWGSTRSTVVVSLLCLTSSTAAGPHPNAHQNQTLMTVPCVLQQDSARVNLGGLVVPFSAVLPLTCPPSMFSTHGSVVWRCKGSIDNRAVASVSLDVGGSRVSSINQVFALPFSSWSQHKLFAGPRVAISAELTPPATFIMIGRPFRLNVKLTTSRPMTMPTIRVQLIERVHVSGRHIEDKFKLASAEIQFPDSDKLSENEIRGDPHVVPIVVNLQPCTVDRRYRAATFENSSFRLRYSLRVKACFTWHSSLPTTLENVVVMHPPMNNEGLGLVVPARPQRSVSAPAPTTPLFSAPSARIPATAAAAAATRTTTTTTTTAPPSTPSSSNYTQTVYPDIYNRVAASGTVVEHENVNEPVLSYAAFSQSATLSLPSFITRRADDDHDDDDDDDDDNNDRCPRCSHKLRGRSQCVKCETRAPGSSKSSPRRHHHRQQKSGVSSNSSPLSPSRFATIFFTPSGGKRYMLKIDSHVSLSSLQTQIEEKLNRDVESLLLADCVINVNDRSFLAGSLDGLDLVVKLKPMKPVACIHCQTVCSDNDQLFCDSCHRLIPSHMPTTPYRDGIMVGESQPTDECVICFLAYEHGDEVLFLPCLHAFHAACMNNWFQRSDSCPICMNEITPDTVSLK